MSGIQLLQMIAAPYLGFLIELVIIIYNLCLIHFFMELVFLFIFHFRLFRDTSVILARVVFCDLLKLRLFQPVGDATSELGV